MTTDDLTPEGGPLVAPTDAPASPEEAPAPVITGGDAVQWVRCITRRDSTFNHPRPEGPLPFRLFIGDRAYERSGVAEDGTPVYTEPQH